MLPRIKTLDYKSDNACNQFVESLHQTGFAILHNHPLDFNLITSVYDEWETFFNSDAKHSYTFNPETQDGYFPYRCESAKGSSEKDLKEFFHLYEWGKYPENVSTKAQLLYHEIMAIGHELLEWIDINSPEKSQGVPVKTIFPILRAVIK